MKADFNSLRTEIIETGLCTGCGTCAGVCAPGAIRMAYVNGDPEPELSGKCSSCGACYDVCPGKDVPMRDLDREFLGRERMPETEPVGVFKACYRAQAAAPDVRAYSSSGGAVSAILNAAFENNTIDAALIAVWDKGEPWKCVPFIATSPDDVARGARTAMIQVPVNEALREAVLSRKYRRVAVVGLPCHIHAIRKLQHRGQPRKIADSVALTIGLFCAAAYYWEGTRHLLVEFGNIENIEDIVAMDYRGGQWPGAFYALTRDGKIRFVAEKHDYTYHFLGASTYKRDRCLSCIDFTAELADISCGDILNPGIKQSVATLTRTDVGERFVQQAVEAGHLAVAPHDAALIPASGLGWEAKKHAGMYRLIQRKRFGLPAPDFQYPPKVVPLVRQLSFPSKS
ncbi:MAG: Coenzyme F420 hydrogenase/dehydrogenase, beta subunit C-terminal domain [Bacillota bacterium]|nr:Coenzyme F420 hydrogenase/dehydrogenase, beta subunit C-terminal domain [Bacillota bacterium]